MTAGPLRLLLWSAWLIVLAALIFASYEADWSRDSLCFTSAQPCTSAAAGSLQSFSSPGSVGLCDVTATPTSVSWMTSGIHFRPVHLHLRVVATFSRPPAESLPALSINVTTAHEVSALAQLPAE